MKRIYFLALLMIIVSLDTKAQQESLITQYNSQMALFNPAAVSLNGSRTMSLLHRRHWANVPMSPITTSFTYGYDAGKNVGLGMSVIMDKVFVTQSTFVSIDYSYRLQLEDDAFLYLGIKAGANFYAINAGGLNTYNLTADPSLNTTDLILPNIGFGAYYTKRDFYFSLGIPRVLDTKQTKTENGLVSVVTDKPHLYSAMGYEFLVSKAHDIYLKPSVFTRIVTGAPMTTDFNTMVSFNRKFEIGATYRTTKTYAALLQLKLDDHFTTGWVYEINSQSMFSNAGNSLEVLLMYQF
ncbi:MAG: PorP/SprF family type IX secretion system membrane protein [Flavobacteriales bacterium]|jgi:type IX secretion system PorP/SprF family membrane protein